jgi:hypothetical protein
MTRITLAYPGVAASLRKTVSALARELLIVKYPLRPTPEI